VVGRQYAGPPPIIGFFLPETNKTRIWDEVSGQPEMEGVLMGGT